MSIRNMKNYVVLKMAIFIAIILSGTTEMMAQEIKGKVVDTNLTPIGSATIVLQTIDSTFVDAVISKEDGTFVFPQGSTPFILTIQHIAYKTLQQIFRDNNVGVIKMVSSDNQIGEVVVTAQKPYVKVEDGKFTYDTKNLIQKKIANNAWDLLNKLPGISSNGSSVSLIGANKVSVMIDGKLSTLTMDQLYTMLNNMPANRVEKAEIIYNAPPQYHVNGAVVNLVMQRPKNSSVEGEIAANYANQYFSDGGVNANLRVATPKTTLDVMYGINRKKNMQYSEIESHHTLHDVLYDINQTERISSKYWEHDIRTSFDYKFNDKNDINVAYTAMLSPDKKNQSHTVGDFQNSFNNKDASTNMHNIALNSRLGIGLSVGIDYTHYNSDDRQNLNIDYNNGAIGKIASRSAQTIDRYAIYADQSHSIKNGWTIGYGASYTYSYDRDYQFYDVAETANQAQNTDSKLKEYKTDLYFSASKQFKKGLSFSASVKGEYYKIGDYQKWALYPQFSINYAKNPKHIYQLGLSTDKTYPKYWSMLSSISYIDGYSEIHGSPGIRPSTNYNLNATYIYNRKYIVGAFYSYTNDFFAQVPYQSTERLALIYKSMNWNYMQNAGINIIVPISIGKWLETRLTGVGMYLHQRCDDFFNIPFNREKFAFMGRIDNTFVVNKNLLFELNANIQSPVIQGTFDVGTISSVNAGMKWNFGKEKMSLSVYCNDIFNTSSPKLTVDYKGQNFIMDNSFYSRLVYAKFIYKFGGFKDKKAKKIDTSRFGH